MALRIFARKVCKTNLNYKYVPRSKKGTIVVSTLKIDVTKLLLLFLGFLLIVT